jgi:hypothetical protein
MRLPSSFAVLLFLCPIVAPAQEPVREGLWEISVQGQVGGQPLSSTPLVVRQCISQQSAQDLMTQLTGTAGGCRVTDLRQEGNHARWNLACSGQVEVSGTGEVTMRNDSFDGTLDLTVGTGAQSVPMSQTFNARWVGACK